MYINYMLFIGNTLQIQKYKQVKSKRNGKYHANHNHNKARVATLISDKIDFKKILTEI